MNKNEKNKIKEILINLLDMVQDTRDDADVGSIYPNNFLEGRKYDEIMKKINKL